MLLGLLLAVALIVTGLTAALALSVSLRREVDLVADLATTGRDPVTDRDAPRADLRGGGHR